MAVNPDVQELAATVREGIRLLPDTVGNKPTRKDKRYHALAALAGGKEGT